MSWEKRAGCGATCGPWRQVGAEEPGEEGRAAGPCRAGRGEQQVQGAHRLVRGVASVLSARTIRRRVSNRGAP